jgi:protein tyrosine phosphatase
MQPRNPESKKAIYELIKMENFIDGYEVRRNLAEKLRSQYEKTAEWKLIDEDTTVYYNGTKFSLQQKDGYKKLNLDATSILNPWDIYFPQCVDKNFGIDANHIEGTNIIVSRGPGVRSLEADFIKDTIFNEQYPVKEIVALGTKVGPKGDFRDIYLTPRKNEEFGNYLLTIEEKQDLTKIEKDEKNNIPVKELTESTVQITEKTSLDEKNTKTRETSFHVTIFPVEDNDFFDLSNDPNDKIKEAVWEILFKLQTENVLIHCAAGMGRSGTFAALLEILNNYQTIYQEEGSAYQKILDVVQKIRKDRLCLIGKKIQFEKVITSADVLYEYGFKKGYVQRLLSSQDNKPIENEKKEIPSVTASPVQIKISLENKSVKPFKFFDDEALFTRNNDFTRGTMALYIICSLPILPLALLSLATLYVYKKWDYNRNTLFANPTNSPAQEEKGPNNTTSVPSR